MISTTTIGAIVTFLVIFNGAIVHASTHQESPTKLEGHVKYQGLQTFIIIIENLIKDPINVHCYSKDDDLGFHTLKLWEKYSWNFMMHILGTTSFT